MTFVITTPLYYVNDKPHLGSTYTTLACDAISRFHRLENNKVIFISGVDEHGQKIQRTAQINNCTPKSHCDSVSTIYRELWDKWDITLDRFVRTTSNRHKLLVNKFFTRVKESGDIKLDRQKGWYCVGCEEYKDLTHQAQPPTCPIHLKPLEWRDEENLFFRLSKYQDRIEELVKSESFIQPQSRKNEIIKFVEGGLKDFSISRVNVDWGISVPGYPGHTFYVWFDALLGYLSGTLGDTNKINLDELKQNGWPASLHVIGKDILRFHAVYWPAMLMSAKLDLPRHVFGHGFLTREGQKMGKSLGNVLDPIKLLHNYNKDAIRWYLLRDIDFGNDGDFQSKRFVDIVNNDLSNTIGNLLNRSITMSRKWFSNRTPEISTYSMSNNLIDIANQTVKSYKESFYNLNFKKAAEELINLATKANIYLNNNEPWKNIKDPEKKEEVGFIIYNVLETTRIIGYLINPITPDLSLRILHQLGIKEISREWTNNLCWGGLEYSVVLPEAKPVMDKLEIILDV